MTDNNKDYDEIDDVMENVDQAIDNIKDRIHPNKILKQLLFQAVYNLVFVFGLIWLITYFWGPMPWLWWAGGIFYGVMILVSVFAYFKAKQGYKKLSEL